MYLRTVRGETRIPSLTSSSLAMRSWPQEGFSAAIFRMSARSSGGIGGRPGHDFNRQNKRKACRCQRINVLGVTLTSAPRQSKNRDSATNAILLAGSARRGLTPRSRYIANCLRRNRISAATQRRGRISSQRNIAASANNRQSIQNGAMVARIMPFAGPVGLS